MFSRFWAHAALILGSLAPLAAAPSLAFAQTAELNWPSKQFVRPREVALNYPCGGGASCDLASFMNRQHVCALLIVKDGAPIFQRTSVRGDDDPCKSAIERDRFGVASMAKSIISAPLRLRLCRTRLCAARRARQQGCRPPEQRRRPRLRSARHAPQLLQMATGMDWSEDEIDTVA